MRHATLGDNPMRVDRTWMMHGSPALHSRSSDDAVNPSARKKPATE
jgi:hypothetical protein